MAKCKQCGKLRPFLLELCQECTDAAITIMHRDREAATARANAEVIEPTPEASAMFSAKERGVYGAVLLIFGLILLVIRKDLTLKLVGGDTV